VKRGYYEAEFEVLAENTIGIPNYEITNLFLRRVEAQIVETGVLFVDTQKMETQRQKPN
jgi:KDO2-lipid IV(A) lauroyltransferase